MSHKKLVILDISASNDGYDIFVTLMHDRTMQRSLYHTSTLAEALDTITREAQEVLEGHERDKEYAEDIAAFEKRNLEQLKTTIRNLEA